MQQNFSPKQVAQAIGASESSVKRWCDQGVLPSVKTAGGHRRLPIAGVIEFLRSKNRALANPEALDLPGDAGSVPLGQAADAMKAALIDGNFPLARRLLLEQFLLQHSLATLFDEVLAIAMRDVGDDWCSGDVEVFQERRGCELVLRLVHELRMMLPTPRPDAPLALGGCATGDPYALPTQMVELVLVECGWNATSMGIGIPLESMVEAVKRHKPRLFWLSVSSIAEEARFLEGYRELRAACGNETAIVVGGRGLSEEMRKEMEYTTYCENLRRLEVFCKTLHVSRNTDN